MKILGLSVWQPWATLVALGEKRFETRSWKTEYRGPLVIQAAKKLCLAVCYEEPFKSVLAAHGLTPADLPRGALVCTCRLADCWEIQPEVARTLAPQERSFGDYRSGRFALELRDLHAFTEPIPFRGSQGFFRVDLDEARRLAGMEIHA